MRTTIDTSAVTSEMLDRTHRIEHLNAHKVFYICESMSEPGTEYKIIYNPLLKCLECLPHTGKRCEASARGITCWHKRSALKASELRRAALKAEQEALMHEFSAEMKAAAAYTVATDPTSSSLDGVKFELAPSGRLCPMR